MIKKLTLAASAFALTAVPVAASAAPAAANSAGSLSLSSVRAGTPTSKSSKLTGLQDSSIVPIVIGVGILAGVTYLIIDHEDDNNSDSN
jgi:opacity protein-like surface antigen